MLVVAALFGAAALYLYPGSPAAQTVGQLLVAVSLPLVVVLAIGRRGGRARDRHAERANVRQ